MPRLALLLCAIAVAGSMASAVLFFQIGTSKQLLEQRLADATTHASRLDAALASANEQNGALKVRLSASESDVAATRDKLAAVEANAARSATDLAQTRSVLELYEQTARALAEEVAGLREDIADLRATHAPPETVAAYKAAVAELEKQLAAARSGTAVPGIAAASTAVFTNRAGRATILNVGPENAFVVLNFGSARGAQVGQKLSISHGTSEVATVLISDVRSNFSIAQVLPDTLRAVLQKGDLAILLRPPP